MYVGRILGVFVGESWKNFGVYRVYFVGSCFMVRLVG